LVYTVPGCQFGPGIEASDLVFLRTRAGDLVIEITGTDDRLTISDQANYASISEFVLDDETTISAAAATAAATMVSDKTAGDDTIVGTFADETLDGGAGNDRLSGFGGKNTYLFDSAMASTTSPTPVMATAIRWSSGPASMSATSL